MSVILTFSGQASLLPTPLKQASGADWNGSWAPSSQSDWQGDSSQVC